MKELIVQKFGGTSLGKHGGMANVAGIVKSQASRSKVVVVVSAVSSIDKKKGTTSKLMAAVKEAHDKGAYAKIVDSILRDHLEIIEAASMLESLKNNLKEQIQNHVDSLKRLLQAVEVIEEISPRTEDKIVGYGEKMSAVILAGYLNATGVDARYVNLENVVDFPGKEPDARFFELLKEKMEEALPSGDTVPVLTGFFGEVGGGILETIGRGYSDLTAALIAARLKADELQIWKEVEGVYSSDPSKVENAFVLDSISADEASELTYYGSEVLHPFTVEQAVKDRIPIRIKCSFKPDFPGTLIEQAPEKKSGGKNEGPSAVTCKKGIQVINVFSNRMFQAYGFMSRVFGIFEKYRIVIDLLSSTEVNISLTLEAGSFTEEARRELEECGRVTVKNDMAILSLVGRGMVFSPGTAGTLFQTLAEENINIEMISQGASEINISCVIREDDAIRALKTVHAGMLAPQKGASQPSKSS